MKNVVFLKGYVVCFFLFTLSVIAQAQKSNKETEKIELAKKFRDAYKDKSYICTSSSSIFTFTLETNPEDKKSKVYCSEETKEEILCINATSSSFKNSIFFDDNTEVYDYKVYKNGKNITSNTLQETVDYSEDGIFHSDAKIFSFSVPSLTTTDEFTYSLKKKHNDVKYLTTFYFHEDYPILEKVTEFKIPKWLEVDFMEKNFKGFDIQKTVTVDAKTGEKTVKFLAKNIRVYNREKHSPGPSYVYPHIVLFFKSFAKKDGSREILFEKVDDMYEWFTTLTKDINNDNVTLKELVKKNIEGKTTDREKIEALFYWVQDNIRYIAFENGIAAFKPESCQLVYSNKFGDCKGMANLLKEMLLIAGYDARLSWIGTRHIAYDSLFPSIAIFNHMICTVFLNGNKIFLDPTETYISYGDIAHRIQGKYILIENGQSFISEKTPEYSKARNKTQKDSHVILENDILKGERRDEYDGEGKTQLLREFNYLETDKKDEEFKNFLTGQDKNLLVSDIKTSDLLERSQPLVINYNFSIKNHTFEADKEKFITLDYSREFSNFIFDSTRQTDYIFSHKMLMINRIDFTVPEGYKVKHLPENFIKVHPDFSFTINYKQEGDHVKYYKEFSIDNGIIRKKDFKEWNEMIKKVKKIYNDQVIIEK